MSKGRAQISVAKMCIGKTVMGEERSGKGKATQRDARQWHCNVWRRIEQNCKGKALIRHAKHGSGTATLGDELNKIAKERRRYATQRNR